jgi:Methyltransferase domain
VVARAARRAVRGVRRRNWHPGGVNVSFRANRAARPRSRGASDLKVAVSRSISQLGERLGLPLIALDFPVTPAPRWGGTHGLPDHPEITAIVSRRDQAYAEALESMLAFRPHFARIPREPAGDPHAPDWRNGWLQGMDGAALYSLVAGRDPSLYIEVGSGHSTKFVRRAIRDHALRTTLLSIDPAPRADVDAICDEVVRVPLEDADLQVFTRLTPGDVCFVDDSHRSFQNSDVTLFFLEVLPRLPAGVLVGLHDIYLPADYPPDWSRRWYSEQYLLAAYLLGGGGRAEVFLPCSYVTHDDRFADAVERLFAPPLPAGIQRAGSTFWLAIV